jgi:GNAT superfamily N-acetyltransferase
MGPKHRRNVLAGELRLVRELAEYEREPDAVVATEAMIHTHLFGEGFGKGPVAECVIGLVDDQPQGFALFFTNFSTWLGKPGIYLEDLYVTPTSRGHGLGKALLRHLAQLAVARNCGRLEWSVLDWNEPAIGFYKSLGAQPMSEWTTFRLTGERLKELGQ